MSESIELKKHRAGFKNLVLWCTKIGRVVVGKDMEKGRLGPGHRGSSVNF